MDIDPESKQEVRRAEVCQRSPVGGTARVAGPLLYGMRIPAIAWIAGFFQIGRSH